MTAFVFSLVLLLCVILFWAFKRLWNGLAVGLPIPVVARAGSATGATGVARATSAGAGPDARSSVASEPGVTTAGGGPTGQAPAGAAGGGTTRATTAGSAAPLGPKAPRTAGAAARVSTSASAPARASRATSPAAATPARKSGASAAAAAKAAGSGAAESMSPAAAAGAAGTAAAAPQPPNGATPAAQADNLRRMVGIGPINDRRLKDLGVTAFVQIAAWTPEDVKRVEAVLAFDGRIARERWIEQAKYLAAGDQAGFLKAFPAAGRDGNT